MIPESKQRDYTMDMVKGVAILAMIVGHMSKVVRFEIYSFHMPLFFILAGIFFTPKEPLSSMKADFKRLIIPFFVTIGVLLAAEFLWWDIPDHKRRIFNLLYASIFPSGSKLFIDESGYIPRLILWFLFAMFWCKTTFNILIESKMNDFLVFISSIILAIVAIICDTKLINLPFSILPGMGALLFFSIGYMFKKHGMIRIKKILPFILFCVLCWLILLIVFRRPGGINIDMITSYYRMLPFDVLCAIGGTFVVWVLSRFVFRRYGILGKFLAFCGMNSLLIMCVHTIELKLPIRNSLGIESSWEAIIFSTVFSILSCIILYHIPPVRRIFGIRHWDEIKM